MTRWTLTVLLMLDQFINALFGGYADETLSHRFALNASKGGWPGCIFCRLIAWVDPDHCDLSQPTKAMKLLRAGSTDEATGGV